MKYLLLGGGQDLGEARWYLDPRIDRTYTSFPFSPTFRLPSPEPWWCRGLGRGTQGGTRVGSGLAGLDCQFVRSQLEFSRTPAESTYSNYQTEASRNAKISHSNRKPRTCSDHSFRSDTYRRYPSKQSYLL